MPAGMATGFNRQKVSLEEWQDRIYARQSSGLTVAAWCKANDVSEFSYYYWLRKLRESVLKEDDASSATLLIPTFCELEEVKDLLPEIAPKEEIAPSSISRSLVSLKLPSLSLEVAGGVSPQEVKVALAVLKSLCC